MNKHFQDSLYYLKRAGEHAKRGLETEFESIANRGRRLVGREPEPEPESESRRFETVRGELHDLKRRAETGSRTVRRTLER